MPGLLDFLADPQERRRVALDALNATSRGITTNALGGAVDLASAVVNLGLAGYGYAGNKLGLLAPDQMPGLIDKPVGGSEWWGAKMQGAGLLSGYRNQVAEGVAGGLLGPAAGVAIQRRTPQIARGLLAMQENAAKPSVGMRQRGALAVANDDEPQRLARMQAMGLERGWYRGGVAPMDGRRTGPWYSRDADEAAGYAKRFGDKADVREYAIPKEDMLFRTYMSYPSRMAHDLADVVSGHEWGPKGAQLAKELRSYAPSDRVPGYEVWQALESRFGNDGAAAALSKLMGGKAFSGATGMTNDGAVLVFPHAPVRDAARAAFDPSRAGVDDIYGKADADLLSTITGGLGLGLAAQHMFSDRSDGKQFRRKNP